MWEINTSPGKISDAVLIPEEERRKRKKEIETPKAVFLYIFVIIVRGARFRHRHISDQPLSPFRFNTINLKPSTLNFKPHPVIPFSNSARDLQSSLFASHAQGGIAMSIHSVRNDFIGFATAALMAWKLIVASAIIIAASPPAANNHQLMLMR